MCDKNRLTRTSLRNLEDMILLQRMRLKYAMIKVFDPTLIFKLLTVNL